MVRKSIAIAAALSAALILFGCANDGVHDAASPSRSHAQPIIDVHLHTSAAGSEDVPYRDEVLQAMDDNNVVVSLLHIGEPSDVQDWLNIAPDRFIGGPMMPCPPRTEVILMCFPDSDGWPDTKWLEAGLVSGQLALLGEMLFVYYGLLPDDPRMDEYWVLAARYDVPVAVHINRGPPVGAPPRLEGCCKNFDSDIGNPVLLRPILERHPDLRLYLQHAGLPASQISDGVEYWDETIALLNDYPNVYVDLSILNAIFDDEFHTQAVRRFADEGLIDRVMFGSDNLPIAPIVERLQAIEFLTDAQRRGIFYDNAATFLKFDQDTIDRHYQR